MTEVFHSSSSGKVARSALQHRPYTARHPTPLMCNFSYIMRTMFETLAAFRVADLMHRPLGQAILLSLCII